MKWAVFVAGLGLAIWGGYLNWTGWLIVQIERGWSSVISGAVFMGAGMVIMALAAVIDALERIGRTGAALGERPHSQAAEDAAGRASVTSAVPRMGAEPAPPVLAADPNEGPARPAAPRATASAPAEVDDQPRLSSWLKDTFKIPPSPAARESAGPAARGPAEDAVPKTPPKITRRYEAQGIQYTLYDDGSIEAESKAGRFRFATITELREHLERTRNS